ncbi:transglutaminase-like cysteine peptidase [Devosia sp. CN2-171]|uniref:transglutaminase-like cysteine peptidase n=1 Tax=Devosia sp. CN2-171 TaxID=3400909 RepID=UPI003BF87E13
MFHFWSRSPRRHHGWAAAVLVGILAGASVVPAVAAPIAAPIGFSLMCLKSPRECQGGGASRVSATGDLMKTLRSINTRVNRAIRPRNDRGDVWSASAGAGDCEDYVLAKRRALIRTGVPSSALRIAYVRTKSGVDHAVLVVRTNNKDMVLDNLTSAIKPLSQTGYRVMSVSSANPMKWS